MARMRKIQLTGLLSVGFLAVALAFCPTALVVTRTLPGFAAQQKNRHAARVPLFSTKQEVAVEAATHVNHEDSISNSLAMATMKNHNNNPAVSKFRRLKDLMWMRETLEDLTACEFACSVEAARPATQKRKRDVDYEKLLSQLNRRIRDMGCQQLASHEDVNGADELPTLVPGEGMGGIVATEQERKALFERILMTRHSLLEVIQGHELEINEDGDIPFSIKLPRLPVERIKEEEASSSGPKLYLRDDGTVDWDGALQDRAALKEFGSAVWARINGQDPATLEEQEVAAAADNVTAKIIETPSIKKERNLLSVLKKELQEKEMAHTALLSSAISAGQAVANVKLASVEPGLRNRIRESAESLEKKKEEVTYQSLNYELERIYTYLAAELGNPSTKGYIPLQDRLNVAEFGLLESQILSFNAQLEQGDSMDADVLSVVMDQLTDFKRRLGIDYYVTGLTYDREAIQRWANDLWTKTRNGIAFYVKGVKLFWNDLVFCSSLIGRAAQGYTLKPREVRNLRRTIKDIITFVPVVIILVIPMTPVGHVLVFGAIQRFFPDFFPSCFTEQRQNLLELYESTEYTELTIKENLKEKLVRFSEAMLFTVVNTSRSLYMRITGSNSDKAVNGDMEDGVKANGSRKE